MIVVRGEGGISSVWYQDGQVLSHPASFLAVSYGVQLGPHNLPPFACTEGTKRILSLFFVLSLSFFFFLEFWGHWRLGRVGMGGWRVGHGGGGNLSCTANLVTSLLILTKMHMYVHVYLCMCMWLCVHTGSSSSPLNPRTLSTLLWSWKILGKNSCVSVFFVAKNKPALLFSCFLEKYYFFFVELSNSKMMHSCDDLCSGCAHSFFLSSSVYDAAITDPDHPCFGARGLFASASIPLSQSCPVKLF